MRLDSHQHFWRYDSSQYPWIKPHWPIRRDFLPPDLQPLLAEAGLEGCIAVQARQSLEETCWLLQLANEYPMIRGVVGWVDLRSERIEDQLVDLARHPRFVGVRHVLQDEPDDAFMLHPDFRRGVRKLKQFRLAYDLLIFPRQLPAAIELVSAFPDQPFVLDHLAKPSIREGTMSPWRERVQELAKAPNVCCKISGMVTEADWKSRRPQNFKPYLDVVFEAFGPDRLMYGSDWPVCLLAAAYGEVFSLVNEYVSQLPAKQCEDFFGGNCARFYRILSLKGDHL
jgi:L-fuconolactonase